MLILAIGVAGGVGALVRWLVGNLGADRLARGIPTAIVNLVGALALGTMVGLWEEGGIDWEVHLVVATGFLGSLTTFSTWMVETLEEWDDALAVLLKRTVIPTLLGVVMVWIGREAAIPFL